MADAPAKPDPALAETVAKYQRVTSRLKALLEQTTGQRDDALEEVKRLATAASEGDAARLWSVVQQVEGTGVAGCRAIEVLCRVDSGPDGEWCLVRAKLEEKVAWLGWVQQGNLLKHVPDVSMPGTLPSAADVEALRVELKASQAELRSEQNEFRVYRIRMETTLRQQQDDLDQLQRQAGRAGAGSRGSGDRSDEDGDGGDGGRRGRRRDADSDPALASVRSQLASAQDRIDKLLETRAEAQERESSLREDVSRLERELAAARTQEGGGSGATTSVAGSGGGPDGGASAAAAAAATATASVKADLDALRQEYDQYRTRAMQMVKSKEDEISQLTHRLRATSVGEAAASHSVVSDVGDSASVRADMFASEATREYLKNILLRYMCCPPTDTTVRLQLEAAIAAVMELTPSEISRVQTARAKAAKPTGIWSLLGGGGGSS